MSRQRTCDRPGQRGVPSQLSGVWCAETWRLAGCRNYWSTHEHPFHVSPTGNQHDAIELALAEYQEMFGHPLIEACPVAPETGELGPVVIIVTGNG